MLTTVAASKAAKVLALCVCPVLGATAMLKVPAVRQAVHDATAPAKKSPPKRSRLVKRDAADAPAPVCPDPVPVQLTSMPLLPLSTLEPDGLTILPDLEDPETASFAMASAVPDPRRRPGEAARVFQSTDVPEPAIWLQTIIGMGVAGSAIRMATRRQTQDVQDALTAS
jgi:hypothetical protein